LILKKNDGNVDKTSKLTCSHPREYNHKFYVAYGTEAARQSIAWVNLVCYARCIPFRRKI